MSLDTINQKEIRMFNLDDLEYGEILIRIAQSFPPDLALFAKFCYSENIYDVLQIKLDTYYRGYGWNNAIERLNKYGIVRIKRHKVNIHENRPDEVKLTTLGRRIRDSLENTPFKEFLIDLSSKYFDTPQKFINYFDNHVNYPPLSKNNESVNISIRDEVSYEAKDVNDNRI